MVAVTAPELGWVEGNLESRWDGAQTALDQIREEFGLTAGWTTGQLTAAERQVTTDRHVQRERERHRYREADISFFFIIF